MQNAIKNEIKRLCRRAAARRAKVDRITQEHQEKFQKRTGSIAGTRHAIVARRLPHRHFDPAYCARNANFLAKSIWTKVMNCQYKPKPALFFQVPKPSGGLRKIMAFTIPDAALANVLLYRARERNLKKLSPFSYAYHPERNVFDAILALRGFITDRKLFAVQIDFENYFDSIPTRYLESCMNDREQIALTPHEKIVLREFLHHQYADSNGYANNEFKRRYIGTPQGSSISLLLANLANQNLDRALERRSGRFVRFADDIVALCSTYSEAEEIEAAFVEHCRTTGLSINKEKSPGIAIIGEQHTEIRRYPYFDYLGYRFTKTGLRIPDRVRRKIQRKLSSLIQLYLIQYPEKVGFNRLRSRSGRHPFDWDLLGLILEVRGYLYGGLKEEENGDFIVSGKKLRRMRGLMGFYALLEDSDDLKKLDSWLLVQLTLAMRKRARLLEDKHNHYGIRPTSEELILGTWLDKSVWRGSGCPDSRLPSFMRGWRAARKYYLTFGLEDVEPPQYGYY